METVTGEEMYQDDAGDYVLYEDYEALRVERDDLQARIDAADKQEPVACVQGKANETIWYFPPYAGMKLYTHPAIPPEGMMLVDDDTIDAVTKAMRRSWQLGQTYWQQADSESYSQNAKSNETQAKFDTLIDDTIAMLKSVPAKVA
jgi:hypothetical protein